MSRTLVKICGLTSVDMVAHAVAAGADAIGLVLAASPRQVTPVAAAKLLAAVPPGIERIAVFRKPDAATLHAIAPLPFDGLQADAEWEEEATLPVGWFFLPVLTDGDDLEQRAHALVARGRCAAAAAPATLRGAFLVDGPRGGGRGIPADLDRAARAARLGPAILAGGLRPDTVAAAVRCVRPFAVDVSSGVDAAPGRKDPALVTSFLAAVRAADAREPERRPIPAPEQDR